MLLAKESLMDRHRHVRTAGARPQNKLEELRLELYEKVNALGIGAQGLGGLTTVLDVKIKTYPTHAANQAGGDDPELRGHPPRHFVMDGRPGTWIRPAWTCGPTCTGRRLQQIQARRPQHPDQEEWPAGSPARPCCSTARC